MELLKTKSHCHWMEAKLLRDLLRNQEGSERWALPKQAKTNGREAASNVPP